MSLNPEACQQDAVLTDVVFAVAAGRGPRSPKIRVHLAAFASDVFLNSIGFNEP